MTLTFNHCQRPDNLPQRLKKLRDYANQVAASPAGHHVEILASSMATCLRNDIAAAHMLVIDNEALQAAIAAHEHSLVHSAALIVEQLAVIDRLIGELQKSRNMSLSLSINDLDDVEMGVSDIRGMSRQ